MQNRETSKQIDFKTKQILIVILRSVHIECKKQ